MLFLRPHRSANLAWLAFSPYPILDASANAVVPARVPRCKIIDPDTVWEGGERTVLAYADYFRRAPMPHFRFGGSLVKGMLGAAV